MMKERKMITRPQSPTRRTSRLGRLALFTGACGLLLGTAAQAADAGGGATAVETIVVTAQKRTENAQTVPISIQSLGAASLATLGAKSVNDIQLVVPSLTFGDGSEQGRTGMRGVVDYSRNAGYDSRVGVYVDGVYLGRSWLNNQILIGVQQVDVLRGPQGTLFGKDTDAGVVSITTRKPTDTFSASAEVGAGSYDQYRAAGMISGPIARDLDAQLSVTGQGNGGYYHNQLLQQSNMGTDEVGGRLQLRYHPNDRLEVNFSLDDSHEHNSTLHYTYVPAAGTNVFDFKSYNPDYAVINSYGANLTVDYALGGGYKLTSISAYRGGHQFLDFNNETGPTPWLTAKISENTAQGSQEVRIASPITPHYDWVAGFYYFHQLNIDGGGSALGPYFGLLSKALAAYDNLYIPAGAHVSTDSYAGFFNTNIRLLPQVELSGGLRYSYQQKALSDFYSRDPYGLLGGNFNGYSDSMSNSSWTPKVGINLHLLPKVLIFADYSTGFKGGGWNVNNTTKADLAAGIKFNPETVKSYEVGFKANFLDNRAQLDVTGFLEDYSNFQVFTFVPTTLQGVVVQTTSLTNAGSVESKGVEVDGKFVVTRGVTLSADYTFDDSKFTSYPGGGGTYAGATLNANGVETPYAPLNKVYLSADVRRPLTTRVDYLVHVGFSAQSSENFDPKVINPGYGIDYKVPAYQLVDARIGVSSGDGRWTAALWGKNLADAHYINFSNRTALLLNHAIMYGAPLTFGGVLTVRY